MNCFKYDLQYGHLLPRNVLTFSEYTLFIMVFIVFNGILAAYAIFIPVTLLMQVK